MNDRMRVWFKHISPRMRKRYNARKLREYHIRQGNQKPREPIYRKRKNHWEIVIHDYPKFRKSANSNRDKDGVIV